MLFVYLLVMGHKFDSELLIIQGYRERKYSQMIHRAKIHADKF